MNDSKSLRVTPQAAAAAPTPEHKRFYTLVGQIEKARRSLTQWHAQSLLFRQGYAQQVPTIRDEFVAAMSEWLFALDRVLPQRWWTRSERSTLREVLCRDATELLKIKPSDAVKELFEKHSAVDFDASRREELQMLKEMTEMFTGVNLGDTSEIENEAELLDHIEEKMAAHEEARQARKTKRAQRRVKSAAQERREQEAQRVTQSVRDIYRKLASALHPDREPDAQARAAKNELMQKVNRAYEANDLLTLLEVQLQIEQVNQAQLQNTDPERIKHYNKVLAEQLTSLKAELEELQSRLELEFSVEIHGNDPRQLAPALAQTVRWMRTDLARQRRDLHMLSDVTATKQWLKRTRQELRRGPSLGDFL